MRRLIHLIVMGAVASIFFLPLGSEASVRVYLRIGPPPIHTVKVIRPVKPYRDAVWVAGHWNYMNGRHCWAAGYWIENRPNFVYVQPHWVKSGRGFYFVPGHWVKR
jgi:hypothetical protein